MAGPEHMDYMPNMEGAVNPEDTGAGRQWGPGGKLGG